MSIVTFRPELLAAPAQVGTDHLLVAGTAAPAVEPAQRDPNWVNPYGPRAMTPLPAMPDATKFEQLDRPPSVEPKAWLDMPAADKRAAIAAYAELPDVRKMSPDEYAAFMHQNFPTAYPLPVAETAPEQPPVDDEVEREIAFATALRENHLGAAAMVDQAHARAQETGSFGEYHDFLTRFEQARAEQTPTAVPAPTEAVAPVVEAPAPALVVAEVSAPDASEPAPARPDWDGPTLATVPGALQALTEPTEVLPTVDEPLTFEQAVKLAKAQIRQDRPWSFWMTPRRNGDVAREAAYILTGAAASSNGNEPLISGLRASPEGVQHSAPSTLARELAEKVKRHGVAIAVIGLVAIGTVSAILGGGYAANENVPASFDLTGLK
jgi:hypothetical protein